MATILDKQTEQATSETTFDVVCAVAPPLNPAVVTVQTTRFGTVEVEEDLIITLPEGIIGFDQCKQYVVLRQDDASMIGWLQSLDQPSMAFPIIEPNDFRPDYAPTIPDADVRALELTPNVPPLVFAIVTIPHGNPRGMTANLLGPLVINVITRQGKQVIVQDQGYTTRHLILEELKAA